LHTDLNLKAKNIFYVLLLSALVACTNKPGPVQADTSVAPTAQNKALASPVSKYSVEQLDNTTGLSNSSVNCIFQDSQNLVWIGTWDGLNRYDGTDFKIFRPQPGKNSISNQVILKIGEDRAGLIWILTMHGINSYDKKTNSFRHFYFSSENKPPVSESQFNMAFDAQSNVYCAVQGWGIGYYDGKEFIRFNTKGLPVKTVQKFDFLDSGRLLILYDDNTLYSVAIETAEGNKKNISGIVKLQDGVRTFSKLANNSICIISTSGNAALLSPDGKKKQEIAGSISAIIGNVPEGMVVWGKSGYAVINTAGNKTSSPWLKYLAGHKITSVLHGNEHIVWAGTDGDGLMKMFPKKKSFNLVSRAQIPELDGGIVRSFLKDSSCFWLGTKGSGLFKLPADFYLHPERKLSYTHFNENNSSINNSVYSLHKGKDNLVFIGTDGEGLAVYDSGTGRLVSWSEIEGAEKCSYFRSVYSIYQDNAGILWLGTNGYGMIQLKLEKRNGRLRLTHFASYTAGSNGNNSLSSNIIFSLIPKNDNQLWVGTRLGGLNLFDKGTGSFRSFKNTPGDAQSLSSSDILCLVTDADNKLWIGTSYGLNLLKEIKDNGKAEFKSFTVKDGLPNNTIHGIVAAGGGNLWLSTNYGLSNFAVLQKKFSNFTRNDGLQNNEFADGAYYSTAQTGFIFMGGIKGFNYFQPENIKGAAEVPDLLIDEISGQNQSVPYYQGLVISPHSSSYPSLTLKHNQNFFDIHLRALTYTNPEKCQYAYQLEGFDENWNNIGSRQVISFTNVPKGKYSLWVKWTNSEGIWGKPVKAVNITVKPVWWQSNLALVIYVVLAVVFLLFVRSYNLKQQSLQQNILIRKKEEELHENRLTFFTNIAHEFLTPLTLIVGPAQKLSENAQLEGKNLKFISMIQRNASRLLFLTQQLLEFRKAEYDYLQNTVKNFDLLSLLEQIAELFDDWALDKNITYSLDIPTALPGWYDKDKLEKIIFNLMSNAFKYTPSNGSIKLKCSIEQKEFSTLNITITNTGKGIPKEKLDSLFDRFFLSDIKENSDTEMFRTGIGLAYVKRLVTVLRGEILVSSTTTETVFTVLIPCEKKAFSEKEIDTETSPVFISQHLKNILEETPEKNEHVPEKILALDALEDAKKKILIVEDENEIHAYLKDLLSDKYTIIQAFNGAEALEILNAELPDIIISDVMMPVMDGVELCRKVKTDISTCHIPFIMLTAKNSVIHRIEGLESGADSYIPKPFYPEHLMVRIQKLLEQKELITKHFTQDTLVENLSAMPVGNEEKAFIKSVIDLVRSNIDNDNLDSAYLEKELGFSTSQLYRKTKETFSLSPGDLIRTIRLKYAAELLRKNQLTVSEVCYKSGFNNRSYFYREFKKVYNTTPKNYQLRYKS
jgi:signal transduction histidine kinase/DNA-binding response OmpR family regulator/ligand-binding sensor domain-containing protein